MAEEDLFKDERTRLGVALGMLEEAAVTIAELITEMDDTCLTDTYARIADAPESIRHIAGKVRLSWEGMPFTCEEK